MNDEANITGGDTPQRIQQKMREEVEAAKQVMAIQQKAKEIGAGKAKKVEKTVETFRHEEEEKIAQAKAKKNNLPYINLMNYPVSPDVLALIPRDIAAKHRAVPYLKASNKVRIAAVEFNQATLEVLKQFQDATGYEFLVSLASDSSIDYIIKLYDILVPELSDTAKIDITAEDETKFEQQISNLEDLKNKIKTVSTTELVDIILTGAVKIGASDIHIEPTENQVRLRYRLDGVLQDIAFLDKVAFKPLLSRIKYLCKMKIDIHNIAQDGRFSITAGNSKYDIRVSLLPTLHGESTVMRLLEQSEKFITLADLGFPDDINLAINSAIHKPNGMILNTGPTGSGKTTTLYAILQELNEPGSKIITLEDPVEYRITGITQSQIDAERGHTFAKGLRSILRQDPDIVLVGEIRDSETAQIATQASLTGHLVLCTLHTNNAAGALPRLIEMGVKPYLIISSINLVIAQRLVRKICPQCKIEYEPDQLVREEMQKLFDQIPDFKRRGHASIPTKLFKGQGCPTCNNTGFKGRIAVIETFVVTPKIEEVVLKQLALSTLQKVATEEGMLTMEQDGLLKVLSGITTIDEVWSVTKE
ncbi:MAG: GspE/PulE family protein [Patescibacteria group bacterium]